MKIEIPYLDKIFPLEIADENLLAIIEPGGHRTMEPGGSVAAEHGGTGGRLSAEAALNGALAKPVFDEGGVDESLDGFLQGANNILIIVNDATRPTPTSAMLSSLEPYLKKAGINEDKISLLVATGAHRAPSEDEYKQILGKFYDRFRRCTSAHDARDGASMTDLGKTRNGTPIILNKKFFEAERIIATGSVEPHYFAGFTGGRKAFLPGCAAFETIEANHKLSLSPKARSLALDGNPVHEDMLDALKLIKARVFSFMTVLDKEQNVAAAAAGGIKRSFFDMVDAARSIFCVPVPAAADIVISVAKFPMDIDLYQSQKAIDNGGEALKDGGSLILVSSCRDGIGDEAYANLLASEKTPAGAMQKIERGFKLGYHKAARIAALALRSKLYALTGLSKERLASMFIESVVSDKGPSAQDLQNAFNFALSQAKKNGIAVPKVLVLPDGCVTVPELPR